MQNTVVEYEVWIVVLIVNYNALLTSLQTETLAEFEDELLQVSDKSILQVVLIHNFPRFQSKKLEGERLAYLQLRGIVTLYGWQR